MLLRQLAGKFDLPWMQFSHTVQQPGTMWSGCWRVGDRLMGSTLDFCCFAVLKLNTACADHFLLSAHHWAISITAIFWVWILRVHVPWSYDLLLLVSNTIPWYDLFLKSYKPRPGCTSNIAVGAIAAQVLWVLWVCGFPHCTGNIAKTVRCQGDLLILHADFAQACFYLFKLESEGLERFLSG